MPEGHLPTGIAHLGSEVGTMNHLHPLHREVAKPDVKRHRRIGQVLLDSTRHVEIRFLQHIVGGDSTGQPAIEANVQHPPEPVAIEHEQLAEGFTLSGPEPVEQEARLFGNTHPVIPCR
jgi:hypothetical protein